MAGIKKYAPFVQFNEELDEEAMYRKIAQNINRIRVEKGISIRILALMADVDERTLYFIEAGNRRPSIVIVYKIATALKVSINDILEDISAIKTGEPNEKKKI